MNVPHRAYSEQGVCSCEVAGFHSSRLNSKMFEVGWKFEGRKNDGFLNSWVRTF